MFLHIGMDICIWIKDIVAIFDIKKSKSQITSEFLKNFEDKDIFNISEGDEKTIIIVKKDGKKILYYSPISSMTIKKRFDNYQKSIYGKEIF